MKDRVRAPPAAVAIFLLGASVLTCRPAAPGEYTEEDFWWLGGEVDEEHATYAPAENREILRERTAEMRTIVPRMIFVGDEPLQVFYEARLSFDVRLDAAAIRHRTEPFEVVDFYVGSRSPLFDQRDMDTQRLTLTVRLPASFGHGAYTLPSLSVPYEFDLPSDGGSGAGRGILSSDPVEVRKVPLYVEVFQEHDAGFIADAIPLVVEIHGDTGAEVVNEYAPAEGQEKILHLFGFEPQKPAVVISRERTVFPSAHYRIIRWRFLVAVQDIGEEAYELAVPAVIWRPVGSSPVEGKAVSVVQGDLRLIEPDPLRVEVRSLSGRQPGYKRMKGAQSIPPGERFRLLSLPLAALWGLAGLASLLSMAAAVRRLRSRGKAPAETPRREEKPPPGPVFDRWPWQRALVGYRLSGAWRSFERHPSEKSCAALRDLLARRAALRAGKKKPIPVRKAVAMTAREIEDAVGTVPEIVTIRELERQLEEGRYRRVPPPEGGPG